MSDRSTDIAWAAGFLDGEGCITLTKPSTSGGKRNHFATRGVLVHAGQNDRRPLDKLAELFGGSVRAAQITASGKQHYQWSVQDSISVGDALMELIPHLIVKREQAEVVLEYALMMKRRGRRRNGKAPYSWVETQARVGLIRQLAEVREVSS